MGEEFVPGHPQAYLSALGSQAHTILFASNMGRLWVQSHIGKRSAPLMPYKYLAQAWVYHYHTQKGAFEGRCPSRVLSALGKGWDWLGHVRHRMILARFCYPWRARLYHWTILLIDTVPQKRLLMWEGFSSRFPISRYCRIVRFGSCLTYLFNLTSGRDASHMCLISLSSRHMCTTIRQF